MKPKTITVTLSEGKHATQPWTVTIDRPGKAEPYRMKQRYCDRRSAHRGACRNLKAGRVFDVPGWWSDGALLKFITKRRK